MPPRNKRNAPNRTNDTGLAAPGKRVSRKASSGQLNGQPNGKPPSTASPLPPPPPPLPPPPPPPALPPTGLNQGFRFPRAADAADAANAANAANVADFAAPSPAKEYVAAPEGRERGRTASDTSVDEGAACGDMADVAAHEPPAPGVDAPSPVLPPLPSGPRPANTISTILAYYPLRDAISILILLLSLPPTLVLIIQTLFASLTFVPPTAGISTLPNLKDIFNTTNVAYPALATILIIDLFFWVCWLPLWKPVQNIFLDLSQAVIAISLSGAAATTGGPTYSIASCTLIVCVVHVLRYKAIHLTALDYLRSVIHRTDIGLQLDIPSFASALSSSPPLERGWVFTVIRTILGIHIVSQGVTTCIRRSLVKANERDQGVPTITKIDSDLASAGHEHGTRSPTSASDGPHPPYTPSGTDGRLPGPSPLQRDGKTRESNSKKKKKQANQVRSQQPLWAAIASTKVTFVKEMEQRDAADDAREAAAMDTIAKPIFAQTHLQPTNRIWISDVLDNEIHFSVELSPESTVESAGGAEHGTSLSAGIDKSKPFYVRVNGAAWSSTRIMSSATGDEVEGKPRFDGEIFGLAPLSSYHCETVSISTGVVLCSVSLITQAAPSAEQAAASPSQPPHSALRPSSPITTLKQSIQSAQAKLDDTRNRSRKTKKDQRGVHSDIRKEINMLRTKLDSSGGLDDKQERRLLQIKQHKTQAEEATAELKSQIDALGEIPPDEVVEAEAKKRRWQAAVDQKHAADRDLDYAKTEADRELNALKSEIATTELKREKLIARRDQRTKELENLLNKHQADMTARQKRELERARIVHQRDSEESQLRFHINAMNSEAEGYHAKLQEVYQQVATLQNWQTAPPPYPGYSSPPTPENPLQGANGSLGSPANGFPVFSPQSFSSPFQSAVASVATPPPPPPPRGRSSSMLSQYSGFTDDGDHYFVPEPQGHQYSWPLQTPIAPAATLLLDDRKESDGSGSGSASGTNGSTGSNSPRPDAKPFIPSSGKGVSPIGPPSKAKERGVWMSQSPGAVGGGR